MRRVAYVLVLAVAILAGALAGNASAAFTNVEQVSKASAQTSANKSITVTCPAGKKVTTAGADVTPGGGHVLLDDIRPHADLSGVTVRAVEDETGTADTWYVAAYAICAPPPAGLVRVAATSAASSAGKGVFATCPAGKRVLGTGAEVNGADGHVLLDGIRPAANLSGVNANALEDQTGTAANWTVTAYAICSAPVTGLERTSLTGPSNSTGAKIQYATCPAHKVLVGVGGEINSAYGQGVLDASFPEKNLTTAGFAAYEDDTGNPNNWSLTTYAVCAAQAFRLATMSSGSSATVTGAYASCPPGMGVTGGGAELTGGLGRAWINQIDPNQISPYGHRQVYVTTGGATPDPWLFSAYALCATPLAGATVAEQEAGAVERQQSATAFCPAGTLVTGAGSRLSYDPQLDREIMLLGMVPNADLKSVTVMQGERDGQDAKWSVTAIARCATPPPGLQLVTRTSVRDLEEVKSVTATCPAGKHLLGTGGRINPAEGWVILDEIRPNQALTSVTATGIHDPTDGNDPWSVSAYAICVNR